MGELKDQLSLSGRESAPTVSSPATQSPRGLTGLWGQEALFSAIFRNAAIGIVVVDSAGQASIANQAFQEMLGYSEAELHGKHFADVTHPDDRATSAQRFEDLFSGRCDSYQVEKRYLRKDGQVVWARVTASLMKDPTAGIPYSVVMVEDISEQKRVEGALRESELKYRTIFDAVNDAIIIIENETGVVLEANQKTVDISGYSHEELLRLPLDALSAGIGTYTWRDAVGLVQKATEGRPQLFEWMARNKNGESGWVEVSLRRAEIDGKIRTLAVIREVGERKRSEAERERLIAEVQQRAAEMDATISSMADGVVICGEAGEIIRMNPAAQRMLGDSLRIGDFPSAQWTKSFSMETAEGNPLPFDEIPLERALHGDSPAAAVMVLHKADGRTVWISISAAPIKTPDARVLGAVATLTDISALHELQEQQAELIHTISHDLRTPLTVVLGHAQILSMALSGARRRTASRRESAEAIILAGRQMNDMIRDLVDSARMEAGQLELNRASLDLPLLVRQVKDRLAGVMEAERIKVSASAGDCHVFADANRVERILLNLLTNALKYSDPDTDVTVTIERREGDVLTSVSDKGQGIAEEDLPKLFQKFGRTRQGRSRRDSLGLGLYITRGLVEAHGGSIWISSVLGEGSVFSFTLPVEGRD